jgi:hypothetical protein
MNYRGIVWGTVLIAAGCSGGASAPVAVAPVSGIVRYNGVPVRDAYVKFSQEGCPVIAGGFTDDRGRFELTTYQSGDGAPVGTNAVSIAVMSAPVDEQDDPMAAAEAISDPAERKKEVKEAARRKKSTRAEGGESAKTARPRSPIPKKYASEDTSKLEFTVDAGVENEANFDLKD